MDEAPHALTREADGVITVTLNRPEKLNPISPQVTETLWEAVRALGSRDDLRVMVITGTGRYFSSGLDLKLRHGDRIPGPEAPGYAWRRGYRSHHLLYDEMESVENGPCLGAGTEMAVSCDFRFCTPDAHWGLPEVRSEGAIPGSGGVSRLTRLVGTHWAKWMALAAQNVSAEDARMMGLVHEIHAPDRLMERVDAFAAELALLHPETVALAKLVIDASDPQDREKVRQLERVANTPLVHMGLGQPARDYVPPGRK